MFTLSKENRIHAVIPDQGSLSDTIYVNREGKIKDIKVSVAINHPFIGDVSVMLLSPSGTEVVLRNREGGSANNMNKVFAGAALNQLVGESTEGAWILTAQDHAAQDDGILESWGIDLNCEEYDNYKTEIFIPQESSNEVLTSTQECRFTGRVTKAEIEVDIEHPLIGDLVLSVVAPSGKEVVIQNRVGGSQNILRKQWSSASLQDFVGEPTQGTWILKIKSFHTSTTGALKHWKIRFHYEQENDLKIVEGIGPIAENILKNAGIYTYIDLAITAPAKLKALLEKESEANHQLHDPSTWPQQAALAAHGRWVELDALKQTLINGKVV